MDKIYNNTAVFLMIYLFCPFLFTVIFASLYKFKNPIYIRRFCKLFFVFEILLLFFITFFLNVKEVDICNFTFFINNSDTVLLFISGFVFLLFSFFTKTFIKYAKKTFYLVLVLLFGLLNIFIASDSISVSLICLFWLILCQFLISNIAFRENVSKIQTKKQCVFDIMCYLSGVFLVSCDFLRYFVLNEINFKYSIAAKHLMHIDDMAILTAFCGFLILIFRQFGFLNLFDRYNKIFAKKPFYIANIIVFTECTAGISLLMKVYSVFDYLFYQYQIHIAIFLLLNILYHTIAAFKAGNLLKEVNSIFIVNLILGLFGIFSFSKTGSSVPFYYFIVLMISYSLVLSVFAILEEIFKTKNTADFKKINDKTKSLQLFVLFSLLNFANVPLCANFFSFLLCILTVSSIEYDCMFLKSMPYVILICIFMATLSVLNLIYKILIDPIKNDDNNHILLRHQKIILFVMIIFMYILLFACQNFINNAGYSVSIGNI